MKTSKKIKIQVSSNGKATVDVRSYIKSANVQAQVNKLRAIAIKK